MRLRWLLALLFVILAAIGGGLLWLFNTITIQQIPDPVTRTFLLSSAIVFAAIFLVFVAIVFFLLGGSIGRPLRRLAEALDAFAESDTRVPLTYANMSPKEVTTLERSFTALADKVDQAHKRDTEVSRVKSDFISTAAHQLRTPLTGIRWALEALEKSDLTAEQKQIAENAATKSHELVAIVGTLLDISSIESGKYAYKFAATDLVALLDTVGKDFAPMAAKQGVSLSYVKSETPMPAVRADAERVTWVLNNLIENALRYTPAGGAVRLSTDATPGILRVHVRDTGIGILPKDRQNIFERFFRGGNAISKENEGNGLGLYIARTIATDHGGDLEFSENTDGPGTTFTLSLPIATATA